MSEEQVRVLGIIGSPDRQGRTSRLVTQALEGAADTGAHVESVFLSDYPLEVCHDCHPWTCRVTRSCRYDREGHFDRLSGHVLAADAVVFGSPVYFGIASEAAYLFMQKMHRMMANQANGIPAFGIAVAGGTGGGLISGLRPIYHFFQIMGMRAMRPLSATRYNWPIALDEARQLGTELATAATDRREFRGLERLAWYDDLPYLGMSRVDERAFLTGLVVESLDGNDTSDAESARQAYAEARRLLGESVREEALQLIDRAFADGSKAFDAANPPG